MRPGIKLIAETIGTGAEAVRGKTAIANIRMFLPSGEELPTRSHDGPKTRIDLAKRDIIAGIRYGIEGMRVGGHRKFIISAHLAYGAEGLPGIVPPDMSLLCEAELLEVRDSPNLIPEEYPPGRHLIIRHAGDLARAVPRWGFGLHEDGHCGGDVTIPIPGLKWKHSRPKRFETRLDQTRTSTLLQCALSFPINHPAECLSNVYNEGGDSPPYANEQKKTACLYACIYERGQVLCQYYIAETSTAWCNSEIQKTINDLIKPVLAVQSHGANRGRSA